MFDSYKKVTPEEYKKFRWALKKRGLNDSDIDSLDMLFHGDMNEKRHERGIDKEELQSAALWLRKNPRKHKLKEEDIVAVEEELLKYL